MAPVKKNDVTAEAVESGLKEAAGETVKKSGKKEAAKKAPVKKTEPKTSVVVEYAGGQIVVKDVVSKATKAFAKANKGVAVKKVEVYVKPEEGVAYYVVNGVGGEECKVIL